MRKITTRYKAAFSLFAATAVLGFTAFEAFERSGPPPEAEGDLKGVPANTFANFESAHVHPMDITPDGTRLLAVNTGNNSLEVYQILPQGLLHESSIPVGMEPVSVRARTNTEAWVVNRVSDNVSQVGLVSKRVLRTLQVEDEPADVIFAGGKAFITCSERKAVWVFNATNLGQAPTEVLLVGEQPRALAVSNDGSKVYVAFFESGNQTTVVPGNEFMANGFKSPQNGGGPGTIVANDVAKAIGPYGGLRPVPNNGASGFIPAMNGDNPIKTDFASMVVRKNAAGQWMDDNNRNWTNLVSGGQGVRVNGWDLVDHDVAVIDVGDPAGTAVTYQKHLGNILMAMAVNPITGKISVVGTDATNEVRFEPNLNGKFLRVNISQFNQGSPGSTTITDLNPHLDYQNSSVAPALREQSLGDPRGIAWKADGTMAYITGMGSNNVIVVDANGNRIGSEPIEVGEGPTGIKLDEANERFYVLNKFDGSISTVDMTAGQEVARTKFFDPTPDVIKIGRRILYDTHATSGTGHISCGSCHVDARWDRLAWDLGDPSGQVVTVNAKEFHPMKGLKTTQWLIDIIDKGTGALHWRGDKETFHDFAGAFQHLQGMDAPMDPASMQQFSDFLANTYYHPNPYRNWYTSGSNSNGTGYQLRRMNSSSQIPYDRVRGPGTSFQPIQNAGPLFNTMHVNCNHCHQMQTGRSNHSQAGNENIGADLRTAHKKLGFYFHANSTAGFGYMSDGAFATRVDQTGASHYFGDYQAELLAWNGGVDLINNSQSWTVETPSGDNLQHDDNHSLPAVGLQHTLSGTIGNGSGQQPNNVNFLRSLANNFPNDLGVIVKGTWNGQLRGFLYVGSGTGTGSVYQPDENGAPTVTHDALVAHATTAGNNSVLTWTVVHKHVAMRLGVDRDMDGIYDFVDGDVELEPTVFLEGPMIGTVMRTDLRVNGLIPTTDPYGTGAELKPSVLERQGAQAPVDWVMVELRDKNNPTVLVEEMAAIVQANGRVIHPDGSGPLRFEDLPRDDYYVLVAHRNHLPAMTATAQQFGTGVRTVDFSSGDLSTYGTDARKTLGNGIRALWAGDVNGNGVIQYTGAGNDRDPILARIGGLVPSAVAPGYWPEDVNLDGVVKYTGLDNDRDPILVNIGGTVPTNTRSAQMP